MLSEQSVTKKRKVDVESGTKSTESPPSVIISEALANFLGVGEREMLQSEVLKNIWEYIKVNHLEVGNKLSLEKRNGQILGLSRILCAYVKLKF